GFTDVSHFFLDSEISLNRIITIDRAGTNSKRLGAIRNPGLSMLPLKGRGNSPFIILNRNQQGKFLSLSISPYQAGRKVPFSRTGISSADNGDGVMARSLLSMGCAASNRILNLDRGSHRSYIPLWKTIVIGKI